MNILVFFPILLLTCVSGKELKCWVSYGLTCKILNGDLTGVDSVTFDIGELDVEDFETVSLIESKLNNVPSGIFSYFIEAKEFVLSENGLKQWKPKYLEGATKLTYLIVTQNSISSLPAGAFAEAPNLETIELTYSKIAKIEPNAFAGLHRLTDLRLNCNKFGPDLRVDTFSEVSESLVNLNLADNEIEKIPEGIFKRMKKLEELSIYYNEQIKEVDGEIFPKNLKKIVGLIQFKINNPQAGLEFELDDYYFGDNKHDEL